MRMKNTIMSTLKNILLGIQIVIVILLGAANVKSLLEKEPDRPFPVFFKWDETILISHAGGTLDGATYTNSREAVQKSIREKFRFIELDLLVTSDGVVFAAHDWKRFCGRIGTSCRLPLSSKEIADKKLDGKYTLLFPEEINRIMTDNPELYLITDKIDDFDVLLAQINFPNREERLLVEVLNYDDYVTVLEKGIKHPLLNTRNWWQLRNSMNKIRSGHVTMITTSRRTLVSAPELMEEAYKLGVTIITLSNDLDEVGPHLKKRLSGFFSDKITPAMLTEEGLF